MHSLLVGCTINTADVEENLSIRKREVPLLRADVLPEDYDRVFNERRNRFVQEYLYPSDSAFMKRLDLCSALIELDLPIDKKYRFLGLSKILDLNKVK